MSKDYTTLHFSDGENEGEVILTATTYNGATGEIKKQTTEAHTDITFTQEGTTLKIGGLDELITELKEKNAPVKNINIGDDNFNKGPREKYSSRLKSPAEIGLYTTNGETETKQVNKNTYAEVDKTMFSEMVYSTRKISYTDRLVLAKILEDFSKQRKAIRSDPRSVYTLDFKEYAKTRGISNQRAKDQLIEVQKTLGLYGEIRLCEDGRRKARHFFDKFDIEPDETTLIYQFPSWVVETINEQEVFTQCNDNIYRLNMKTEGDISKLALYILNQYNYTVSKHNFKATTLLNLCEQIPREEDCKKGDNLKRRIVTPFIKDLEKLKAYEFITGYSVLMNENKLTPEEVNKMNYKRFKDSIIHIDIDDYPRKGKKKNDDN